MALRRSATSRLASREDALLRHDRLFARGVSAGLRLGLGLGLLSHGDGPQLLGQLDQLAALDLQLLDVALLQILSSSNARSVVMRVRSTSSRAACSLRSIERRRSISSACTVRSR